MAERGISARGTRMRIERRKENDAGMVSGLKGGPGEGGVCWGYMRGLVRSTTDLGRSVFFGWLSGRARGVRYRIPGIFCGHLDGLEFFDPGIHGLLYHIFLPIILEGAVCGGAYGGGMGSLKRGVGGASLLGVWPGRGFCWLCLLAESCKIYH